MIATQFFFSSFIIAVIHSCCFQLTGLDLIKREEFAKLETLLQAEFQPLSRLLLLLGWMHCQSLDSAKTLLRVLHNQQVSSQKYDYQYKVTSPLQLILVQE